jgi:putative iron-regulated protein
MRVRNLISFSAAVALTAAAVISSARAAEPDPVAVIDTYGDIALAMYEDALSAAKVLQVAVDAFIADPTDEKLQAAKDAWKAARVPYQQTEGYRFGNAIVDDWEGKVNAWPLDEGLIDYVDTDLYGEESEENPLYTANVIANPKLRVGADEVDATSITPELLSGSLQEAQGVEANVATGYHAIEFLLWGQDLHGTEAGSGERPATDYSTTACTHENCDRRAAYLKAATDLLVADLEEMVANWKDGGAARAEISAKGPEGGLSTILTGLGSLSYGELAGERIKLGLLLHDPEEEHDCFSDNTHNSHYYDEIGMRSIWAGKYTRVDGSVVEGPSIRDYATAKAGDAAKRTDEAFDAAVAKLQVLKDTADAGKMAYDQMIGPDNADGNKIVDDVVQGLVAQARAVEGVVTALGLSIELEGSDSLDNPSAVQ